MRRTLDIVVTALRPRRVVKFCNNLFKHEQLVIREQLLVHIDGDVKSSQSYSFISK